MGRNLGTLPGWGLLLHEHIAKAVLLHPMEALVALTRLSVPGLLSDDAKG